MKIQQQQIFSVDLQSRISLIRGAEVNRGGTGLSRTEALLRDLLRQIRLLDRAETSRVEEHHD